MATLTSNGKRDWLKEADPNLKKDFLALLEEFNRKGVPVKIQNAGRRREYALEVKTPKTRYRMYLDNLTDIWFILHILDDFLSVRR